MKKPQPAKNRKQVLEPEVPEVFPFEQMCVQFLLIERSGLPAERRGMGIFLDVVSGNIRARQQAKAKSK